MWGAKQQQLGRPSSVLLSSINDQSGPSGGREAPNTRTWHRTKDREGVNVRIDRRRSRGKREMGRRTEELKLKGKAT